MLKRIAFFCCLPVLFLLSSPNGDPLISKGSPSGWVKSCDFALEPIQPSQAHLQYLLSDIQKNLEDNITYVHKAIKILDKTGLDQVSQPRFVFDPFYQKIIVHNLRIFRNGQWLDRLENSAHQLLQREEELDDNVYNGDLTLVFFLKDLRVGDILEYSCSYVGKNPFFSRFADFIDLQDENYWEKGYRSILIHSERIFSMKLFNTSLNPTIKDLSPTLQEWSWELSGVSSTSDDKEQPAWHEPEARVQISQYTSWKEVVQQLLPLFHQPVDLMTSPSPLAALVEEWKSITQDPVQLATLALRFVQDEVRYLGFENGLGAFKPRDPRVVLEHRFGDCKDKAFLLQAILRLLDIPCSIVLVHSEKGKGLTELLPMPGTFDHAVLRIELGGSYYYVDPTIAFQGGSLQDNHFPYYHWGLVIDDSTTELLPLPEYFLKQPILVNTSIVFSSHNSAEVKTRTTMTGFYADAVRTMIQSEGTKKFSEQLLDDAQTNYRGANIISAPEIIDDRERNILMITESYRIASRSKKGGNSLKVFSVAIDMLDNEFTLQRTTPFALAFPLWMQEHIRIENPFSIWSQELEIGELGNASFQYSSSIQKEGNVAEFDFELKHLKDHVPVESIEEYWNMVQEIETNPCLELILSHKPS